MIQSTDELLAEVIPFVPGCADVLIEKELRSAWRTFCNDSFIWRQDAADIPIADGESRYLIEPNQVHADLRKVRRIDVYGPTDHCFARLKEGKDYYVEYRTDGRRNIVLRAPGTIHHANQQMVLRARLILIPFPGDNGQQAAGLIREWSEAICEQAMFRLHSMTGRPWADLALAAQEEAAYKGRVTEALSQLRGEEGWL